MAKKPVITKIHSGIAGAEREEAMQTRVMRILACTLSSFKMDSMRRIYEASNYYLSEIQKDLSHLMSLELVAFERPSGYRYGNSMQFDKLRIPPQTVLAILRDTPKEEADELLPWIEKQHINQDWKIDKRRTDMTLPFVRALLAFYQNDEWKEKIGECSAVMEKTEFLTDHFLVKIIVLLLEEDYYAPFVAMFPPKMKKLLRNIMTERFINMTDLDAEQKFRRLYFDENNQPLDNLDSAIYVLQNELMANGHIDELLEKYSRWPFMSALLQAVKALHDGDTMPMLAVAAMMEKQFGIKALAVPFISMWLCAALMMNESKEAAALASKLYKRKELKTDAEMLRALLEYRTKGAISVKTLDALTRCLLFKTSQHLCFTLLALHYQIFTKEERPNFMSFFETNMTRSNMSYMRMLFAAESEKLKPELEALQEKTGMRPFFPKVERKEDWELKLDRLIDVASQTMVPKEKAVAKTGEASSRVAYLLSSPQSNVQPILQKTSNNGATWTKGRNIALRTFMNGGVEGMTHTDRVLSKMVDVYSSYWSGTEYELSGNDVIAALAGHPFVFTNDDHRLKIDIVLEPLQLSVTNGKNNGFTLKTNVDLSGVEKGYFVDSSNKTCWRVVKVDSNQKNLIEQLSKMGTLPAKAKDKLSTLLSHVSHSMTVMSDILNVQTEAKMVEASSLTVVQLVPEDDWIRVSLFAKPFLDVPPYLVPGKGIESISGKIDGKVVQTRRDLKAEMQNLRAVEAVMQAYDDRAMSGNVWLLDVEQTLTLLDKLNGMKEQTCVEWPEGVKMKVVRPHIMASDIHVKVRKLSDWFTVDGEVRIDENTQLKMSQLLHLLSESQGRFIRLGDQEFVALSQDLAKYLRNLARLNTDDKQVRISSFSASLIDELEQAGVDVEADKAYRSLLKRITEADTMTVKTPKGIQADLRDYQKEGFQWLSRLSYWGAGACLADDMGLGKTLQSIAILFAKRSEGASLVVAPASVLQNWQDEIARFAPSLHTIVLNKNGDARAEIVNNAAANDVVITSYGLLVTEQELLASKQWNITVLDEAHTIKNRDTKMSKAAMTLQSSARIALTGTPLQNRLSEIWNIFQFLNPGLLGSYQQFSDNFITPIEKNEDRERQRLLKRVISPFMLRRTKTDVLSELPQKTEITVKVNLSDEERALYENLRQQAMLAVESGECNAIQALAELTRLRQAACNAQLIDARLDIGSSKAEAFMQLVGNLHDNHHRALVFSQFTSHLALIRRQLDEAGINYLYLDGSTPIRQRAALVNEFQTGDAPLFLISLKAGGLGLNLTAADYVIHLDPWWNPAIEDQASDRSYRIGQQKPVTVYRLIATNTIEEKILSMHQYKKSLADALLEGSDLSARMTREEILELLHEMK